MKINTRLILALDTTDTQTALRVSSEVRGLVDAIKLGFPLVLNSGREIIARIADFAPVLCDFKISDVPHVNEMIARIALQNGADSLIVHGFIGRDGIEACIRAAGEKQVFVVAEMSHPGALEFMAPVGEKIALLAMELGAQGIVAPATRPERIKKLREIIGDKWILSPGIGAQGGNAKNTIEAGADFVIVGRTIYNAPDPHAVALKIVDELRAVKQGR